MVIFDLFKVFFEGLLCACGLLDNGHLDVNNSSPVPKEHTVEWKIRVWWDKYSYASMLIKHPAYCARRVLKDGLLQECSRSCKEEITS